MVKYHRYEKWEDWQNGMFSLDCEDKDSAIESCVNLLCDESALYDAMKYVSEVWVNSAEQNMSDPKKNHRSWLGQAACCYENGSPEWITRAAWGILNQDQKDAANLVADKVYNEWKSEDLFCY